MVTPKCNITCILCNNFQEKKNRKRKEKEIHLKKKPSKQTHAYYRSQRPHTAGVTSDIIKQSQHCWQVSTNQGNLISVAFQPKLIFFLLAVLVIEQIYTSVMGFYLPPQCIKILYEDKQYDFIVLYFCCN